MGEGGARRAERWCEDGVGGQEGAALQAGVSQLPQLPAAQGLALVLQLVSFYFLLI